MTTFSATGFSCEAEDKDFDHPTHILDEPFSDFFEEYLTYHISNLSDHVPPANDFDFFDFFTDGETTSSATDSTSGAALQPQNIGPPDRRRQENPSSLTKTAFSPRNYRSTSRREKLVPAVSGLELLHEIEGQTKTTTQPPRSAPATQTTLPLRRKPRLSKSRVSKASAHPGKEQSNMISPVYNYHIDSPQSRDWAHDHNQRLEASSFLISPLAQFPSMEVETDARFQTTHMSLREQFLQGEGMRRGTEPCILFRASSRIDHATEEPDTCLEHSMIQEQEDAFGNLAAYTQELQINPASLCRQSDPPSSWAPPNSACSITFPIDQIEMNRNHGSGFATSCYGNGYASKSAPALPYKSRTKSSGEKASAISTGIDTSSGAKPTRDYIVGSQEQLPYNFNQSEYPDPASLGMNYPPPQEPSCSPPRRTSSPTTHPSTPSNRRRSKSAQRRKSAGNLKSTKSPVAVGFVNLTANDSKRILTGVAPSGSSKTKARREQEAHERKRKLSLAVLKAVEEVGGDPEPLLKEGLLIDG
ncbi:MAG: hypothetical protein Q9219_004485 [cf. Caloplaca sp. 3 TL-2023]